MKAVMLSIRPEWCNLILQGRKTVEVRKTKPEGLKPPFKGYIYCTMAGSDKFFADILNRDMDAWNRGGWSDKRGRVIGEFICDNVRRIGPEYCIVKEDIESVVAGSCLTAEQVKEYAGWKGGTHLADCRDVYGWHISDLKIYDKPRSLHEFCRFDFHSMNGTGICGNTKCENYIPSDSWMQPPECAIDGCYLKHPPQSWCYVEELK